MKKITIAFIIVIILLNLNSCISEEKESMTEALKISTWVMEKNFENMLNLNILFECDGIVELETEAPNDKCIQLAYNYDYPPEPKIDFETMTLGKVRMVAPINYNLYPLGKDINQTGIINGDTIANQEYYLNVNAYKLDGTLYITAKLKLVVLEDKEYTSEYYSIFGTADEERSRFFSIELVSYEYNDIYKFD